MAAQKGRDLLFKIYDGTSAYATIGGLRNSEIKFNSEMVDITDFESADQFRELLANAGVKSISVSGSGIFKDDAAFEDVHGYFTAQSHETYQIIVPDFGTYEGSFQVTELTVSGEYNGQVQYNVSLESAGTVSFTAA